MGEFREPFPAVHTVTLCNSMSQVRSGEDCSLKAHGPLIFWLHISFGKKKNLNINTIQEFKTIVLAVPIYLLTADPSLQTCLPFSLGILHLSGLLLHQQSLRVTARPCSMTSTQQQEDSRKNLFKIHLILIRPFYLCIGILSILTTIHRKVELA